MHDLHIRNVPLDLYKRLRARAEAQRRSLSAEAITLMEMALKQQEIPRQSMAEILERIRKRRETTKLPDDWPGSLELLREDRER